MRKTAFLFISAYCANCNDLVIMVCQVKVIECTYQKKVKVIECIVEKKAINSSWEGQLEVTWVVKRDMEPIPYSWD
jgi:hypothetical protein